MTISPDVLSHLIDLFDYLPLSNRNYIVDGNMESIIASSVALTAGGSTSAAATMYYVGAGTSGAGNVSTGPMLPNNDPSFGMTSPNGNYLNFNETTPSTGLVGSTGPFFMQRIEDARTLQGRSATFSVWLWTASGTASISMISLIQSFGTGGSPSAQVQTNVAVNWNLTTVPTRFSVRIDIPSAVGKTFGTNGYSTSYIEPVIWLPVGSTFNIVTTQWQLEQCSPQAPATGRPTAFEYRGQQAEAARVRRYYETLSGPTSSPYGSGGANSATIAYAVVRWLEPKRVIPSIYLSAASSYYLWSAATGNVTPSAISATATGTQSTIISATASGMTTGQAVMLEDQTGASFIVADARL